MYIKQQGLLCKEDVYNGLVVNRVVFWGITGCIAGLTFKRKEQGKLQRAGNICYVKFEVKTFSIDLAGFT
ncbi:MAG: hypothetical protein OCD01_17240 [Fibrobacterales bacterium]